MEIICLGFLLGIIFTIVVMGASAVWLDRKYGKDDKKEGDNEHI
mgnify:CR=1 FL=1